MSVNRYFDKVFIINLVDNEERWKRVSSRFKKQKIKTTRFCAIDGRCTKPTLCKEKLKTFELIYDVKIKIPENKLKVMIPATSLTIGTITILRAMIRNKWKRVLICEDDIYFSKNFKERFKKGIKELENKSYDLLYLGCGGECGVNGISEEKKFKYKTGFEYYSVNKDDLRMPCDSCKSISENVSQAYGAEGTWCYAVSLKGAKKILKLLTNAGQHIDQFYNNNVRKKKLKALAFDPPIVYHEYGLERPDSAIPWQ